MKVLLFSDFGLPSSCANATRVISFAKAFKKIGYDVELLGVSYKNNNALSGSYDGINYSMLQAGPWTHFQSYKRIRQLNYDIEAFLKDNSKEAKYDIIFLSNIYYDHAKVFLKYARKNGAKLIVNSVEWYDRNNTEFNGIIGKIKLIKNRIALRIIHVKMKNIVAISTLLGDYYKNRNCNTIVVPTIVDMLQYKNVERDKTRDGKFGITIAYAGSPAKKDYVINAVKALELLTADECAKIKIDFYGPTEQTLRSIGFTAEFCEKYKNNIVCHGRIPQEEVKNKIANSDFTILLRPDKRYANAGFPTKVGESMACGTPVIANITSDLGKYIIDGKTGIVCDNETPEACANAFRKAIALSAEQHKSLSAASLEMANVAFNYESYVDPLKVFVEKGRYVNE